MALQEEDISPALMDLGAAIRAERQAVKNALARINQVSGAITLNVQTTHAELISIIEGYDPQTTDPVERFRISTLAKLKARGQAVKTASEQIVTAAQAIVFP